MDYKIANKQIDINDILRLADMLEECKEEWIRRAKTEDDYISSIDTSIMYEDLQAKVNYEIAFKDGRNVTGTDISWVMENILDIDVIKNINIFFSLYYYSSKSVNDFKRQQSYMNIRMYITREPNEYRENIKIEIDSNLDDDSKVIQSQIMNMKNEYEKTQLLSASDIMKFAKLIDNYAQEWRMKEIHEKQSLEHSPSATKKAYNLLDAKIRYRIEYYDGKEKTEEDYEWFKQEVSNVRAVKDINIIYRLSYIDKKSENEAVKMLSADIYFHTSDKGYYSSASYNVDSKQMETEADSLYGKIESIFRNNPTRYDAIIKYRKYITIAISTAVGIIISYILYLILRLGLGNSDGFFNTALNNKTIIVFGQWITAILGGYALVSWFINMKYQPMLPDKKYLGYSSSRNKGMYSDNVEKFVENSEVQIGKYYDLRNRRKSIKKAFKISILVMAIQLLISVILFIILK